MDINDASNDVAVEFIKKLSRDAMVTDLTAAQEQIIMNMAKSIWLDGMSRGITEARHVMKGGEAGDAKSE